MNHKICVAIIAIIVLAAGAYMYKLHLMCPNKSANNNVEVQYYTEKGGPSCKANQPCPASMTA